MAIDKELLEILVCPQTHQRLHMADPSLLERVNAAIGSARAKNKGGKPVADKLVEALVREDLKVLYPIRDGIPFLLIEEGIEIDAPA